MTPEEYARVYNKAAAEVQGWVDENRALGGVCDFCATPVPEENGRTWTTGQSLIGNIASEFEWTDATEGTQAMPMYYSPEWWACMNCDPIVAIREPEALATHVIAHRSRERLGDIPDEHFAGRGGREGLVRLYRKLFERLHRVEESYGTSTREEFYERAMGETMDDEMAFALTRANNVDRSLAFSLDAYEAVAYQVHDYLLARTMAYHKRHGRFPESLRAEMKIEWDKDGQTAADLEATEWMPWYTRPDSGPGLPVDGEVRLSAFLAERRQRYERRR
jgi:hypothetical protein